MKRKELIQLIEGLGFVLLRNGGSHALYVHSELKDRDSVITVSHSSKEFPPGTLRDIRKVIARLSFVDIEQKKNGDFNVHLKSNVTELHNKKVA